MNKLYRFSLYTIFNVFSIRWTLLYQQIYPTDFQSLNLGSCLINGGDLFCQKYRRHSYCSTQQDECFCLPGYVSVYEMNDSWYTCKPLLTDLYCRMDSDCSYIHGSICHPGVGACVCPSGYEFTFHQFSCFPRVNDISMRPYCIECQKIGGVCLWNDRNGELLLDNDDQDNVQCACPRRSSISVIKEYPYSVICNSFPADIGEECNSINKVCLSQKAVCLQRSIDELHDFTSTQLALYSNVNICICHEGMIPVYQKNLDYFECFVEETDPTIIDCQNCLKSQGKCYQYNIGSIQNEYGCSCPLFKQNTMNTIDVHQCFKDTCPQHYDMNSNMK
ncbi:Endoglin antigen [Schistosoma japonicum]|nr:Endoglin antigen [Schistosoma japonicum]